jgi:hypothetical protein
MAASVKPITLLEDNSGSFLRWPPVLLPIRWRLKTVTTTLLTGEAQDIVSSSPVFTPPGTSISTGDWGLGGILNIGRTVCLWDNGSGYFFRRSFGAFYRPYAEWNYVLASTNLAMTFTTITCEVDYEATLASLRESFPPEGLYVIGAMRLADSLGTFESEIDLIGEGFMSLEKLNSYYRDRSHEGSENIGELFIFNQDFQYDTVSRPYGPDGAEVSLNQMTDFNVQGVTSDEAGTGFNEACHNLGANTCISNTRDLPMYMKVWVNTLGGGGWGDPEETVVKEEPEETPQEGSSGNSHSSGIGSSSDGLNDVYSSYGNSILPFDSIYLTGVNYNSFVSAGGGIICGSGIFPQSDSIYIEKIRLDVEGSTMTVIEAVNFDATPSLQLSEKIYGYLLDDTHTNLPVFSGYVVSCQKRLRGDGQEIIYECRDLSYFLDQFFSPSHYIYRPPSYEGAGVYKTFDRVLKEILNVAGIPDAQINLPSYTAPPTSWVYQDVRSILEWVLKYFGKYVYYIDRHGRLNIGATDSGITLKTYTIGNKSEEISVEAFEPISDFSRSRSRVILTGDYEITEKEVVSNYSLGGELHPDDNKNKTGIFWFEETIDEKTYKFYYFMYKPGSTLNSKLLSDPAKSASVALLNQKVSQTQQNDENMDDEKELNIRVFKDDPGDSEIYVEDKILNSTQYQLIRTRYATRTDSPIQVSLNTGLSGGVEVVRRPEFKKATSPDGVIDDTPIMRQYIQRIVEFYRPVYGGQLTLDGLDLDLYLLGKVNISGSSLPTAESNGLIVYSIEYDVKAKRTVVDLSNKVYGDLPFFDVMRERSREHNELLAKMGLVEETELYQRV